MPYSLPKYNTSRFSIGPAVVYMGPFLTTDGEPTIDVGGLQAGATLSTTREKTEVFQGFPKTLVDQLCTQETASVKFTTIEWNLSNLQKALGAGTVTLSADALGATVTGRAMTGTSTGPYTPTVAITPAAGLCILPGSCEMLDGAAVEDTDDGEGGWTSGTGSVDYLTGALTYTFAIAPSGAVTLNYKTAEYVGQSLGTQLVTFFCKYPMVAADSVKITVGTTGILEVVDNILGVLTGNIAAPAPGDPADTNTVDYETGKCVVKFTSAPTAGSIIAVEYTGSKSESMAYGGEISFQDVAVKLRHDTPKGSTITVKMWKCQGSGALEVNFAEDTHSFPMEFNAMVPFDPCLKLVLGWDGTPLAAGEQLFKIEIAKAALACSAIL